MDEFMNNYPPGLLDMLGIKQEDLRRQQQTQGLLAAGLQLLAGSGYSPVRRTTGELLGQAGATGLGAYQQAGQASIDQALRGMQVQQMVNRQRQQEAMQRAAENYRQRMTDIGGGVTTPSMALAGGGGPTMAAAERIGRPIDTAAEAQRAAMEYLTQVSPETIAAQALKPPEMPKYITMEGTAFRVTPQGLVKEVSVPKTPLVQNIFEGKEGFKNELELKSQFKSEPVYKAFQEMQSAYGQVTESLKKNSPAGDLAGATKFMKLLDPGSVVRESELFLAMSATGALDRFTDYANKVIKGTKLTPSQRQDFQGLADRLFSDAASAYNAKRNEYSSIGSSYGLNAERALGSEAKLPSPTQTRSGSIVDQAREEMKRRGL